ncbi:zinc metalloprotease HtpX [Candidatus Woesearchaeota archaeon]|nr:zinc metalloprotease HtpX [Candidatus Woesearchaeota archaeon]
MGFGNQIKTVLLLGLLTGLLLVVGRLIGGQTGLFVALIFSVLMNFGAYWFSDKIVLAMYRAKPADKKSYAHLHKIVDEVVAAANIPKPKVYIIPTEAANAFATGRSPKHAAVACTEGIMKLLTDKELKGVIAHEISHVKNRDILVTTIAATIAGVISYLAHMAQFAAIFGGGRRDDNRGGSNAIALLALAIITPIIAMILQLAISRSREFLADHSGATTIKDGEPLASALAKLDKAALHHKMGMGNEATASLFIVNPLKGHGLISLFSTHPPLDIRIKRLKEMKF